MKKERRDWRLSRNDISGFDMADEDEIQSLQGQADEEDVDEHTKLT